MRPRRSGRFPNVLARFARDSGGGYTVEFAFMGSFFIVVCLVIFQYLLVYLTRDNLSLALEKATRDVLTGSFQQANAGTTDKSQILANLAKKICDQNATAKAWIFDCTQLKVDVRVASSFSSSGSGASAIDSSTGTWSSQFGNSYTCPGPASIAVVRAAVKYPVFARALRYGLGNFADGSVLLQAAAVFRVEPYQSNNSGSGC